MKDKKENKPDYFMDLDLPIYGKVGLIEGKGIHYFNAMKNSKGDMSNFLKFIILELLLIDGKPVEEDFLDQMSLKDVGYLVTVVGTMMEDNYKKGI